MSEHLLNGYHFWEWFSAHHSNYLQLDDKEEDEIDYLLNELLQRLHQYCDQLYFKIGAADVEVKEFIITAEGNVEYFERAEDLVKMAPKLKNWKIMALSPPEEEMDDIISYDGLELDPQQIWFIPLDNKSEPHKFGIRVCLDAYDPSEDEKFFYAINYILEKMLGEKANALDIQYMEVSNLPVEPDEGMLFNLEDLPSYIYFRKTQVELN